MKLMKRISRYLSEDCQFQEQNTKSDPNVSAFSPSVSPDPIRHSPSPSPSFNEGSGSMLFDRSITNQHDESSNINSASTSMSSISPANSNHGDTKSQFAEVGSSNSSFKIQAISYISGEFNLNPKKRKSNEITSSRKSPSFTTSTLMPTFTNQTSNFVVDLALNKNLAAFVAQQLQDTQAKESLMKKELLERMKEERVYQ